MHFTLVIVGNKICLSTPCGRPKQLALDSNLLFDLAAACVLPKVWLREGLRRLMLIRASVTHSQSSLLTQR